VTSTAPEANTRKLGDFAHVDTADAGNLVARLDAMHALRSFQVYKQETFELLRARPGARLADVGCGTGEDARAMAGLVAPDGEVTGFDLSVAMLDQARGRHAGVPGLDFVNAPADALGAADESFDAVRADRVLIHVPDAAGALREMIRVTKSGGRVVISEPDMPGCWVASSDYATTDQIMRQIAQSCIAPYLARDLMAMFRDAGMDEVALSVRTVLAFDPASVGKILDFGSVIKGMLSHGLLSEDQAQKWMTDFAERGLNGRFAAGVNIMIVSGTKP
jgi:ubiquinone/menaquinone biosynthesis C-methylase UbiE